MEATYNNAIIKSELTNLSGKSKFEDNVIKRLHLERNSFSTPIKYLGNDSEMNSIGFDEDVHEYMISQDQRRKR